MRCPRCDRYLLPGGTCPACPPLPSVTAPPALPGPTVGRWPAQPAGATPGLAATVASRPVANLVSGRPNRGLRALAVLLAVVLVVSSPGLLSNLLAAMIVPIILVVLLLWLLSRVGLLPVLGLFLPRPRARVGAVPSTELAFRCNQGGAVTDVRLRGHSTGIALGDTVSVRGVRVAGVLHAAQVRNLTTGTVLWRDGVGGTTLLVLLDAFLLLSVLQAVL